MRCEKRFCRYGSCDGCTLTEISLDWTGRLMMGLARAGISPARRGDGLAHRFVAGEGWAAVPVRAGDGFADGKTAPPPEEMGGGAGAIGD